MDWHHLVLRIWIVYLSVTEVCSSTPDTTVLSFKCLDDLIDGIEDQVKQSDKSFKFTAEQEFGLNSVIVKIKKSITDGDSVEQMNIIIKELEKTFSDLTGYNIEMSFITQLRIPTVMNEALKQMFIWINMMMSETIEFSALEIMITEYLAKLKANNPGIDPNFLKFCDRIVSNMKSYDFAAGMATILNWGTTQQSYLPADISPLVKKIEDIINAVETVCKVKLDAEVKSDLSTMINELKNAIKEKKEEKELVCLLNHLERKLKSAAKRNFDLSFVLDLDLEDGGVVVDMNDWKSISASLIEIQLNSKTLPADQVITRLKVWLSNALEKQDLLPELKIRLEVLLEQITYESAKITDPGQLIIILIKDIEEDKGFNPNDLPSIIARLKGIIANPGNLPPCEIIKDLKILISKALVCPDLSSENKIKFQTLIVKIEEVKRSGAEPADIFKNLKIIIDTQLSEVNPPGEIIITAPGGNSNKDHELCQQFEYNRCNDVPIKAFCPVMCSKKDNELCHQFDNTRCDDDQIKALCPRMCSDTKTDHELCQEFEYNKCDNVHIKASCPVMCSKKDNELCHQFDKTRCNDHEIKALCPRMCSDNKIAVCSEVDGFFKVAESPNQCFKIVCPKKVNWDSAKSMCESRGLELAKMKDSATAIAVRQYVNDNYDAFVTHLWIGGRGKGSEVEWIRDGSLISKSDSAWRNDGLRNMNNPSISYCLWLMYDSKQHKTVTTPYYMYECSHPDLPLCEVVGGGGDASGSGSGGGSGGAGSGSGCEGFSGCSGDWHEYNCRCYKFVHSNVNWNNAQRDCKGMGGGADLADLTGVDLKSFQQFLKSKNQLVGANWHYWLVRSSSSACATLRWNNPSSPVLDPIACQILHWYICGRSN